MLERRSTRALLCLSIAVTFFAGSIQGGVAQDNGRPTRTVQMVNVFANLEKTIDAKKSKPGDPVLAKVTVGAKLSDGTVVSIGSVLSGHVNSITPSENKGDSTLVLTFDKLTVRNGKEVPIKGVIVKVSSFASTFGQDQGNSEPDANRPAAPSDQRASSTALIAHPLPDSGVGTHPIDGLTLSGSPNDPNSGTLTQARKNIHLTNNTEFVVSVAAMP